MKLLPCFLATLLLSSCGPDKYLVSFHMEASPTDSNKFAFQHTDGYVYTKVPFISQKDIESYYSFPAGDNTYGIVVKIKKGLHSRIEGETTNNLGKQILPIVNGHTMKTMRLYNRPITSGQLPILGGFSAADLAAMAEFIPPANAKREEAVNKMAAITKPLLPANDPAQAQKEAKDPEANPDRTVLQTRRGRY